MGMGLLVEQGALSGRRQNTRGLRTREFNGKEDRLSPPLFEQSACAAAQAVTDNVPPAERDERRRRGRTVVVAVHPRVHEHGDEAAGLAAEPTVKLAFSESVWNQVGLSEEERQTQLEDLLRNLIAALTTKVECEQELRDHFLSDIAEKRGALAP